MRVSFVHEQIPVAVEYAAVGPSGQQTGGRGWWWWTGPGCCRSLQEQVCIQRLEWQLLETVCFRFKTKANSILVFRKIIIIKKRLNFTGWLLTNAVFRKRHIPLWRSKLFLAFRAAAVSRFRCRAGGQQFCQNGGTPVVQLPICCQKQTGE